MLEQDDPSVFQILTMLNRKTVGKIFIFVGPKAENYAVIIDKSKHDVRECEPYFFPEDDVQWKIR